MVAAGGGRGGRRAGIGATGYRPVMDRSPRPDVDLEALVLDALERLPAPFRDRLGSVAIVVEDEATPELLASVGAPGLFGLYQGIPRTTWSADASPTPSKITIFRDPLMRAHRDPAALAQAVDDTVYHEIAHHFGISDARLMELKRSKA
jgi:predicted Zn-dependent protease with MMP-like domain